MSTLTSFKDWLPWILGVAAAILAPAFLWVCFSFGWTGQFPEWQLLLRITATWTGIVLVAVICSFLGRV